MNDLVNWFSNLSTLSVYDPKAKRNTGCPKEFPRFRAQAMMFALFGTPQYLADIMAGFRKHQHTLFSSKHFKYCIMQGEFSIKMDPHIQGMVQMLRGSMISSQALYKLFKPVKHIQLQCEKCRSPADAVHYCSKPHDQCNCEHCEKARGCEANWHAPLISGVEPKGRGKGRFDKLKASLMENPTQRNLMNNHFGMFMRYPAACQAARKFFRKEKGIRDYIRPDITLNKWEMKLSILMYVWDPRDRQNIVWINSTQLNSGKTIGTSAILNNWGWNNVFIGMSSLKHVVANYDGESVIWFNFPKEHTIDAEDVSLLEAVSDGGMMQAPMYGSDKNFVNAHIIVTANEGPPVMWKGPDGRLRLHIDLNPAKKPEEVEVDTQASRVILRKRKCAWGPSYARNNRQKIPRKTPFTSGQFNSKL